MTKATIPLAKGLNLDKLPAQWVMMEKYDGVPVVFTITNTGIVAETRPGKPVGPSVDFIVADLEKLFSEYATWADAEFVKIVAEIQHTDVFGFKNVSGEVRRQVANAGLYGRVFDYVCDETQDLPWLGRMAGAMLILPDATKLLPVETTLVDKSTVQEARELIRHLSDTPDDLFEGWIHSDPLRKWEPNVRQWGYQKDVIEPTVDLVVVGFEEAVSKTGEPKGMVGRIIVQYKGKEIGCGPGKMTHAERAEIWEAFTQTGRTPWSRIAQIKYKRDPQYTALRQPTFQCWRDDKTEPNEE